MGGAVSLVVNIVVVVVAFIVAGGVAGKVVVGCTNLVKAVVAGCRIGCNVAGSWFT